MLALPSQVDEKPEVSVTEEATPAAEDVKPQGAEVVETPKPEVTGKPAEVPQAEEEFDEVLFNREVRKIPKSERKTLLQKGLNYDKVVQHREQLKAALEEAAKLAGYANAEVYQTALEQERTRRVAEEKGVTPEVLTQIQGMEQKIAKFETETKFSEQRETLKDAPHFAAHEKEIVDLARQSNVNDLEVAYAWYLRLNYPKLTEELKKQAVEEHKRQASKGGVMPSDESPAPPEVLDLTPEEKAHGERRVAQGHFKDLKEYTDFLRGRKGVRYG
jgi:hypothetical protein